jgi:tRNA A37 threonylcarbamoyladenosine biosynthesis protein TsaE
MVKLYHIDLYRISSPREAWGLGLGDLLGDEHAVCIIEWAERAKTLIPPEHLWVTLGFVDPDPLTQRSIHFAAHGERHQALLEKFRREAFGV